MRTQDRSPYFAPGIQRGSGPACSQPVPSRASASTTKAAPADTGFDATFRVTETTPLYRFRFEELARTEAELRDALRKQEPIFADAIPPTPLVMNRYSSAFGEDPQSTACQVIGEVNSDTPGEPMIVFRPMAVASNISEVNFPGNSVLDKVELWKADQPRGGRNTLQREPLFRQMLDNGVRLAYEEKGRIRVAFPKIETCKIDGQRWYRRDRRG